MSVSARSYSSFKASLALAALAAAASAAEAGGLPDFGSEWQVGGVVFVAPTYEGAKDYEVRGAPFIAPAGLDDATSRVQFRGPDDLRFRALEFSGFEAGPLIGWRFVRDESDAFRLRGLGDVDGGLVLGGYAGFRAGPLMPFNQGDQADILRRVGRHQAMAHRQFAHQVMRGRLVLNDANDVG